MRLKKLRQLATQIQQEVKDVSDSQVTIQILRTSRVGKEAVKTVKVMRNCRGTISATVDKWKECLSKGSEKKKVHQVDLSGAASASSKPRNKLESFSKAKRKAPTQQNEGREQQPKRRRQLQLSCSASRKQKRGCKVANVKVKFIRPGFQNLRQWCEAVNHVYIGRAGVVFVPNQSDTTRKERYPKRNSIWANPFKVGKQRTRHEAVRQYRVYIEEKIKTDPATYDLSLLRGKTLGCWCHPEACHGHVLKRLVDEKFQPNSIQL